MGGRGGFSSSSFLFFQRKHDESTKSVRFTPPPPPSPLPLPLSTRPYRANNGFIKQMINNIHMYPYDMYVVPVHMYIVGG